MLGKIDKFYFTNKTSNDIGTSVKNVVVEWPYNFYGWGSMFLPQARNIFSHAFRFFSLLEMKKQQFFFKLNQKRADFTPKKSYFFQFQGGGAPGAPPPESAPGLKQTKVFTYLEIETNTF